MTSFLVVKPLSVNAALKSYKIVSKRGIKKQGGYWPLADKASTQTYLL